VQKIRIKNQEYALPMYIPDATLGVVRGLDQSDLENLGLSGLMVNTYHLVQQIGREKIIQLGGIKNLMKWSGLIASDSGGFQLFSLIQKNPNLGKITDDDVILYSGIKKQHKTLFTPEDSIRMQFAIQSDIMICLDDFTPPTADAKRIEQSVERTIAWAKRSKAEFDKQLTLHGFDQNNRPLLLAPIQGHKNGQARLACATALQEMNFDIYGLGGWPFVDGQFDYDFCSFNASLTPKDSLRFALGIGTPVNIIKLFLMGYQFFDCVLPTRDARHQRLYTWRVDPETLTLQDIKQLDLENRLDELFEYIYIAKGQFANDLNPISPYTKQVDISRAYLHHLFKAKDISASRIATLHNLAVYMQLMEVLRRD